MASWWPPGDPTYVLMGKNLPVWSFWTRRGRVYPVLGAGTLKDQSQAQTDEGGRLTGRGGMGGAPRQRAFVICSVCDKHMPVWSFWTQKGGKGPV